MRSLAEHARVVALLLPLYGCILFVSPFEVKDHCTIAGTTACSKCIRDNCQPAIDTCCGDGACSGSSSTRVLDAVDRCGLGDKDACVTDMNVARLGPNDEAVRSCVVNQCKAACMDGGTPLGHGPQPTWTCSTPRQNTNACATCIYSSCTTALDECCADASCPSTSTYLQQDMGACVAGDAPGCAAVLERDTSGLVGVVRACITKKCSDKCMGDGRPHQACSPESGGDYCSCYNADEPRGPECSATKVGATDCVIGKKGCTCGSYSCSTNTGSTDGCSCDFHGGAGDSSCTKPTAKGRCCLKLSDTAVSCSCDDLSIGCYATSGEYVIADCNAETVHKELADAGFLTKVCSR